MKLSNLNNPDSLLGSKTFGPERFTNGWAPMRLPGADAFLRDCPASSGHRPEFDLRNPDDVHRKGQWQLFRGRWTRCTGTLCRRLSGLAFDFRRLAIFRRRL